MSIFIFWLSLFLFVYTFVGYPALLILLERFSKPTNCTVKKQANQDQESLPDVEVILIVRNVAEIIQKKIQSLLSLDYPEEKLRILIVSDQSDDDTVQIINNLANRRIRCIENKVKSSKSACLNQAIALSVADILLMTDARQTHEPNSLKSLILHFGDPKVGAVSGELVLLDPETNQFAQGMDAYWRYEKFIRNLESKLASVPGVTGAIYAMRRTDFEPIPSETLLDDVLIPMNMILAGKRVLFENSAVAYDIPSSDPVREKTRKTRTLAGNWQLLEFKPQLLNPFKNRIFWQFLSHKILRLFAPLFLVAIFTSSFIASDISFYYGVFILQIVAYTLLLLAKVFTPISRLPFIPMAQSFMTLMWFTVLGFWKFITRNHLAIWK